jgi:hypothetical protein
VSIPPQDRFVRVADPDRPADPGLNAALTAAHADVLLCRHLAGQDRNP